MTQVAGDDTVTSVDTIGRRKHRDKQFSKGNNQKPSAVDMFQRW